MRAAMTESADAERAYYFQDLSSRAIARAAELSAGCGAPGEGGEVPSNPCGDDLGQSDLDLIEAVKAGRCAALSPWQDAQIREMLFWRSVAFCGYRGKPQMFPLHQELLMASTFYRTGWRMAEFRYAAVVELGCGPLGMIEYLPAARSLCPIAAYSTAGDARGTADGCASPGTAACPRTNPASSRGSVGSSA